MDIRLAKQITRKFNVKREELSPMCAGDWKFIKRDAGIYISSQLQNIEFYFSSAMTYLDTCVFNDNLEITKNNLIGNYYFTSTGLVEETEFFVAEDLLESNINNKIKKADLNEGYIYLSENGKKYIYLGELKIGALSKDSQDNLLKNNILSSPFLYSLDNNQLIKLSSIKLIQEIEKNKEIIVINGNDYRRDYLIKEADLRNSINCVITTDLENIRIINQDLTLILNYVRHLYKWEQKKVYEFIKSTGTKLLRKDLEIYDSLKDEKEMLAKFKEKKFLVDNKGKIYDSLKEFKRYISTVTLGDIHNNMYSNVQSCSA